jgi:hypothetical protein
MVIPLIVGVVTAKREGKEIILQFNASVKGHYFEPGYVHFRRLAGGNDQMLIGSFDLKGFIN